MRHLAAFAALCLLLGACQNTLTAPMNVPRTTDADAFAVAFLGQMQARSFASRREYCGLFGRDVSGTVRATAPVPGHREGCVPTFEPPGFKTFAIYHSHGAFDRRVDAEVPSAFDLVADREDGLVGYISTPGGRVWRSAAGRARLLCGPGCIPADPNYVTGFHGPVSDTYTAHELHQREQSY